ncbi:MAG: trypsin-like peptidase domain-containing protein [Patescibacteria group bacterium]
MKKVNKFTQKELIIIIIAVSFVVSSVSGFFAGGAGVKLFELYGDKSAPVILNETEEKEEYSPQTTQEQAVIKAVKENSPAVVSIIISKDLPVFENYFINPFDDFDDFFGNNSPFNFQIPQQRQKGTEKKEIGGGTGFIVSSDGMIVTNKHVVEDEEAEYTVLMNDGKKYEAKVLARDPVLDVAIIKIDDKNLPTVILGDSNNLQIGQSVIAIGNALGEFRNTVSIGVVSGLARSITATTSGGAAEKLDQVIQTDAAINKGNSGGPLLNLRGEVIGINTAIAQGAQNIGFALPINAVKKDIKDVKEKGKIIAPFLGVRYILINEAIKKVNNLEVDHGALIQRGKNPEDLAVIPGSPADKAGLVENDIVLEIDGQKITEEYTLADSVGKKSVGDTITLKVLHKGEEKTLKAVLEERK